ncbi:MULTISPECIES: carboxypeptidase-like regulatory domain-containing protein [unclassified Flavobacterium]|uniref:carboxypeptidase-like regulatory domain-containing protein n=1 Tax=unclassified Flavobacterium TaxID=196869 RepID=UPI001F12C039|nr:MULTISPECIES: carboxypeptidase-like regulatory domain-containing protein [unclassified Flavobacterium]UMY64444.1 carboxypeptidase-like regulatory domain-containing protein [Flavobacterium sp. HJ-32-4]
MKKLFSLLCLLIGISCFSQSDCQTDIIVTVKSADLQNPIDGAAVSLVDSNNTISPDVMTDATGVAKLSARCDAAYFIRVYKSGYEPTELPVSTKKGEVSQLEVNLIPIDAVHASAGYIDQFIVRVYNPTTAPLDIRFGPNERTLATHTIRAGELWESEPYQNISDLMLWISTGRVTKKYMTKPGKAYQIEFNRGQRCYVIKEVDVHR